MFFIGEGGVGIVHEGERQFRRRRVASKVVRGGRTAADLFAFAIRYS